MRILNLPRRICNKILFDSARFFYRRPITSRKITILIGSSDHKLRKSVIDRINFFFDKEAVSVLYTSNFVSFIYVFFRSYKLYFGFDPIPKWFLKEFNFYNIDPNQVALDCWQYHEVLSNMYPLNSDLSLFKDRFVNLCTDLKRKKSKVYLFATGSSLSNAISTNFDDGNTIACNTIVKDQLLWNHIKPDILVAGDALYHYSDSSFSKAFRKDLVDRLRETPDTCFVYPILFHPFIISEFAEFKNRLIPIPTGTHVDITNDMSDRFELPGLGNVLNLILLPVSIQISKNIYLWGFDGRAPSDKDFWKNSDKHFYPEHVDEMKAMHPKFYSNFVPTGDQAKYVNEHHGDELDLRLSEAEKKGWNFYMLHFTHTYALNKRQINVDQSNL